MFFKYNTHPGDLFRSADILQLPNPDDNQEEFLVQFLDNYQSDQRVAYINDLFKSLDDEFANDFEKEQYTKLIGNKTPEKLKSELKSLQNDLTNEAYKNFYNLLLNNKIELSIDGKKFLLD